MGTSPPPGQPPAAGPRGSEAPPGGTDVLLILAAAVLFSTSGAGIKACGFGAWQLGGWRAGIAALTVWLLLPEARRDWNPRLLPAALSLALMHLSFVWSGKTTTAANAILIQSAAPVWVLLAAPLVLREAIRPRDAVTVLVCAAGLALLLRAPESPTALSPDIGTGNLIGFAASVFWASAILGLRALRDGGAAAAVAMGNAIAFAVALPFQFAGGGFRTGPASDWAIVAALGAVQSGLAYVCFVIGLRRVEAVRASLIALLEPVLNPVWVWLLFRSERPGPVALLGGGLVLLASLSQAAAGRRQRSR
jgi:DME family drug/metabolite transporter